MDGRQRQPPGRRQAASASKRLLPHRPPRDIPLCWRWQAPSNRQQSLSASTSTSRAKGVPAALGDFFSHADLYRADGYLSLLRTGTTAARPMTRRRDRRPRPMAAEICLFVYQPDILVSAPSTPPDERQRDDLLMRKGDLREPSTNRSQEGSAASLPTRQRSGAQPDGKAAFSHAIGFGQNVETERPRLPIAQPGWNRRRAPGAVPT